jgi:hypothetical protein
VNRSLEKRREFSSYASRSANNCNCLAGAERPNHKDLEDLKEKTFSRDRSFAEPSATESLRYCLLRVVGLRPHLCVSCAGKRVRLPHDDTSDSVFPRASRRDAPARSAVPTRRNQSAGILRHLWLETPLRSLRSSWFSFLGNDRQLQIIRNRPERALPAPSFRP